MNTAGKSTVLAVIIALLVAPFEVGAQVPDGYYDTIADKTGGELKQALHEVIRRDNRFGLASHTVVPYGSLLQPLREIWRDPTNSDNILLIYSSSSVDAYSSWNREHLWPRARGNSEQRGPDESDLFHVVPSDVGINNLRGNLYFDFSDVNDPKYSIGGGGSSQFTYDSDSWQPPPEQRGDIARAMFYMDVRYNGSDTDTSDLELVSLVPAEAQMANLNTLLLWHAADPPDDAERARNDKIYFSHQGNRNPFIDRPDLVAAIWGSGLPGDPLGDPLARVTVISSTASESPSSPARFRVSLNQFAGTNGVTVSFSMSGTAGLAEYSLAIEGLGSVLYDSSAGSGSVLIPQGYATVTILLTPQADSLTEVSETAQLNIVAGPGYQFTPDASSSATVTIRDAPSFPISWNFNTPPGTDKVLAANVGEGSLSLSNWGGGITNYIGRTNTQALGLIAGTNGNGSSLDFNFSMTGFRSLSLSFYTRSSSSGFNSGFWSASTNGIDFTTNTSTNTAVRHDSTLQFRSVDFSFLTWLNDAANLVIRYTLSGATSTNGTARLDDLTFSAISLATGASPPNDYFIEASVLDGADASASGSNIGATREAGEPLHANTGSASVWWRWTASQGGVVTIETTGSDFDTVLAVYTGTTVGALTRVVSDDDSGGGGTSRVTFNAVAGTTYRIAVDGYGSATGNISLSLAGSVSPSITSFTPTSARPGASVTINGFNFSGATAVRFGNVSATSFNIVSDNQIVAVVSGNAVSGTISVVSGSGTGQSSSRFGVARLPSVAAVSPNTANIAGLSAAQGAPSASSTFSVTASNLPAPLRVAAPAGLEVSLDGQNFASTVELSAPERSDSAVNYPAAWTNGANAGTGFSSWYLYTSQGTGAAGAVLGNPADSEVTGFGARAFSLFAGPVGSGALAYASRSFRAPLAVGDTFSFRWAVNWDPNTGSGYNYFNLGSGGANLVTIWQGNNPGPINFRASGGVTINTGIAYGTGPMTWTFGLIDENTLRVTATRRDGSNEVVFTRDVTVSGAPDYFVWYAYQLDDDVKRRLYFNDLRIDSASPGGGSFGAQTLYVRLAANAPVGNVSGTVGISSGGQSLSSVGVSGTVTGTTSAYDAWAQSHGLDPQGNGLRGADADGDGHSNLHEFLFGALPSQATSSLWRHEMQSSGLVLTFLGRETGAAYKLMSTANLAGGAWIEEALAITEAADQNNVPSGHRRQQVTVPNPAGTRFFRLQAVESSP
jgi:endonuclease I